MTIKTEQNIQGCQPNVYEGVFRQVGNMYKKLFTSQTTRD